MTPQTSEPMNAAGAAGSNQVLTFTLGNETYGVDILRVQEIRGWPPVDAHSAIARRTSWAC